VPTRCACEGGTDSTGPAHRLQQIHVTMLNAKQPPALKRVREGFSMG